MAIATGEPISAGDFVSTSSGASDEGKVAKLDASGQLDQGFLKGSYFDQQTFSVSGTWNKPSRGSWAIVEVWGAGGSGGVSKDQVSMKTAAATGGGGGEYVAIVYLIHFMGDTVSVTIGTGGAAQTRSTDGATAGAAGGNSSFGAYATANGGGAGNATVNDGSSLGGGAGGTGGSTGIIQMKIDAGVAGGAARGGFNPVSANAGTDNDFGGAGGGSAALGEGYTGSPATSSGGTSTNGGNGGAGAYNATATDGASKGGGGGGSVSDNATSYSSGKGGDGYCRVTVF